MNKTAPAIVEIDLGLRPDLTGKGAGATFHKAGLAFAQSQYNPSEIILAVAAFNERTIHLYRKIGFTETGRFMQQTYGDTFAFLSMRYSC